MNPNIGTTTTHQTQRPLLGVPRLRRTSGLPVTISVLFSFLGLSFLLTGAPDSPEIILALAASLIFAACIIRWPITGTYMAVVMVILFDAFPSAYAQTWLSELGVFRNLSYRGLPSGILVSLFEIIVVVSMLSALVHRFHDRKKFAKGPLFWLIISFGAIVLVGEVSGILSGGDFKISLWEIRPLLYLVVLYLLAMNTVSEPRHLRIILWLTVICVAIRAVEGVWRYTLIPANIRPIVELVLEHDDSLFMAIPFGLVIGSLLWRAWLPKRFFAIQMAMIPLMLYVMMINSRRAAYMCIMLIVITALPMAWISIKSGVQRQRLILLVVLAAVASAAYLGVFWNKQGGMAAPAQAVRSMIDPNERDYNSNLYRVQEIENLRFTIKRSPITGIGFGKPMEVVTQMVDLSNIWSLQLYMPHNNVLWVWLRMGLVGFVIFWILIGASVLLIMKSLRAGLAKWKALQDAEQEQLANLPYAGTGTIMQLSGKGLVLRVLRIGSTRATHQPNTSTDITMNTATANTANARTRLRRIHLEMQQCVDFLLIVFLAQTVMVSMIAIILVDQGLMSFRLMPYMGIILGTLAATWSVQSLNCQVAAPANNAHIPSVAAPPGRRVRLVAPTG